MTAIVKKIKVGLSQEEIDELKPFDGTYDGDINANGFISIQNKNITFGGAKSNSVEVSFKNGSRNGNSSEELAFLSDLVGSDVAQSVIDLGELSGSPLDENHNVLDNITTSGLYTFVWMRQAFLMSVYNDGSTLIQRITYEFSRYYERRKSGEIWSFKSFDYGNGNIYTSAGDTSKKLYLIGAQTITDKGTRTYTHDTVYVDTDGHLYDSGNRVLTTADNASGGAVSGDYLPHHTITVGSTTTPMSTVLSAYGSGLYAITINGPESGKYIFNVQHQGGTIYGLHAINISTNAISSYYSEDMSTVTITDFKNSFTSFLKTTGGTITGDLSVAGNLKLNNTRKIVHGNDLYEYTFPEKSGTVALLSDIQNETKLHVYETSNKVHNKDFHQVMLYALQNAPEEMPFAIRLIVGYSGNRYQFIGVKKNLGTTHRVYLLDLKTYYTYKSNEFDYQTDYSTITLDDITISMSRLIEGIPTSLAGFSSASAGIYGATLTSGLYSFNCLLDDGNYLNFTMDLNENASYTQVSPIIKDWGEGAFERLSYYKGTLKYVDQDGQPLSSYNTIQIRRLYSY